MGVYEKSGTCAAERNHDYDYLLFEGEDSGVGIVECIEAALGKSVPWSSSGPRIDVPVYRVTIRVEAEQLSAEEAETWWLLHGERPPAPVLDARVHAIVARVLKKREQDPPLAKGK